MCTWELRCLEFCFRHESFLWFIIFETFVDFIFEVWLTLTLIILKSKSSHVTRPQVNLYESSGPELEGGSNV